MSIAACFLGFALAAQPAPTKADAEFWRWFEANASRLAARVARSAEVTKQPDEAFLDEIHRELRKAVPGIAFEVGYEGPRAPRVLVLSADGLREHFPEVRRLAQAAPKIPGWKVVAFRPRRPEFEVTVQGLHLRPGDVWFRAERRGGAVDVVLHVRDPGSASRDTLLYALFQLLDATLGEYDVETRVAGIDFEPLPADPKAAGLRPLPELAAVVDAVKPLGPER